MSDDWKAKDNASRYPRHEKAMVRLLHKEASAETNGGEEYVKESFTVTVRNIGDPRSTIHYGRTAKEAAYLMEAAIMAKVAELSVIREEGLKMSPDGYIVGESKL